MPGQATVATDVLAAGMARTVMALPTVAAAVHAEAVSAGQIATGTVAAAVGEAAARMTTTGPIATAAVGAVTVCATLQIADLLDALTIRTVAFDHRSGRHTWLPRVGSVSVEQKEPIDQRTAAARRDDHSSEAHIEHVFHGEIPSVRKRQPAAMDRRSGFSETTGGIGRAATAG